MWLIRTRYTNGIWPDCFKLPWSFSASHKGLSQRFFGGWCLHVCQAQEHLVTNNPSLKPCHINHPPVAGQVSWTAFRERASSPFSSMPKSSCPSIRPVYWTTTSHRPCASNLPSPESVFEPLSKVVDIIGLIRAVGLVVDELFTITNLQ